MNKHRYTWVTRCSRINKWKWKFTDSSSRLTGDLDLDSRPKTHQKRGSRWFMTGDELLADDSSDSINSPLLSLCICGFSTSGEKKKKGSSHSVFINFFFLHSETVGFRSIFRGGKELCCWADQVSANIRELLINHGLLDAAGCCRLHGVCVSGCSYVCACKHKSYREP